MPRVPEFKRCKGCQGIKGAKGAWVKSSKGLLRGRVFSRTHLKSSLSPEEGPTCFILDWCNAIIPKDLSFEKSQSCL